MTDHDARVSQRYAELAREEAGGEIDAAILAASRRSLARNSWSRRWAAPVSIAAVMVLAVGVTLQMQHEQPDLERPDAPPPKIQAPLPEPAAPEVPPPRADRQAAPARSRKVAPPPAMEQKREHFAEPKPFADQVAPRAREEAMAPVEKLEKKDALSNVTPAPAPAPAPAAAAPAAPATLATPPAPQAKALAEPQALPAPMRPSALGGIEGRAKRDVAQGALSTRLQVAPARSEEETELERIAKLRVEGRNAEADKALAEFRRKYPDFTIPPAMWERVKSP